MIYHNTYTIDKSGLFLLNYFTLSSRSDVKVDQKCYQFHDISSQTSEIPQTSLSNVQRTVRNLAWKRREENVSSDYKAYCTAQGVPYKVWLFSTLIVFDKIKLHGYFKLNFVRNIVELIKIIKKKWLIVKHLLKKATLPKN